MTTPPPTDRPFVALITDKPEPVLLKHYAGESFAVVWPLLPCSVSTERIREWWDLNLTPPPPPGHAARKFQRNDKVVYAAHPDLVYMVVEYTFDIPPAVIIQREPGCRIHAHDEDELMLAPETAPQPD